MADAYLTFSTDFDNTELEKKLYKLNSDIKKKTEKLLQVKDERAPLAEQSAQVAANLDRAKQTLDYMRSGKEFFPAQSIKDQESTVRQLQKEFDAVQSKVESYDAKIQAGEKALGRMQEDAGGLEQKLQAAADGGSAMGDAINRAQSYMAKFTERVKKLAKRVFVFTIITAALRSIKNWMGGIIRRNNEAAAAMAQLRGALLTLAQPLAEVVIPLFTALVQILTRVVSALAQVFAYIAGKPISAMKANAKALNAQADAIDGVGNSAKKASKSLAGFDELNVLSAADTSPASGGASAAAPDFNFDANMTEDQLKNMLTLIELIAAGILGWKLGNGFTDGLKKTAGIFLAIDGTIGSIRALTDAWTNGVNLDNLLSALGHMLELSGGLYLAFGKVGAGIGLVVSGAALLVTAFHDMMENGMNLENTLMSVAGLMLGGLGIAVLTGSWIPILIAAIAALLVAVVNAYGDTEQFVDGIKTMLDGFADFFAGIFTGDIDRAIGGIEKIFKGLQSVLFSIVDALKNMFLSFLDWLDEKTGGKLHGIIEFIKSLVAGAFTFIKDFIGNAMASIKKIFTGIVKFLSGAFTGDWDKAWEGIKDIFDGISTAIKGTWASVINAIIRALNWLIDKANKISFTVPGWVPGLGGKHIGVNIPKINELQIPKLAQGAVIPPNREFMAVLGDQKHGTNIEAPLDTIKQAVAEVLGQGSDRPITIIVQMDGKEMFRQMVRENNSQVRMNGKSPLLT